MVPLLLVLAANLLMAVVLALFLPSPPPVARADSAEQTPLDLSSLNVRLSTKAIHPPDTEVKRTVLLPDVRGARPLYGEPARAAILEDDRHRRVLILSTEREDPSRGGLRAYLLHEFELERYLPELVACARARGCALDRTPATGGLACIAICLVEALRQ